jgi:hypothetical protein
MPGAPIPDGQLSRPEAELIKKGGTPPPTSELLRQGVPRSPEEAFGIGVQASIDQTYLDEVEQQRPRRSVWLAVAAVAIAAVVIAVVVTVGSPEKPAQGSAPGAALTPTAPVTPSTAIPPSVAPPPGPEALAPALPETVPTTPVPATPPPVAPTVSPPAVASPQPDSGLDPALAATPPTKAKVRTKADGAEPATPGADEDRDPAKLLARANSLYQKGKLKAAIVEFKKLVDIDEGNDRAHIGLGTAYFDTDQNGLAVSHLERALALNPRNGQALVILGNVRQAMGDNPKAKQAYERYLAIEPNGKFAADVRLILQSM